MGLMNQPSNSNSGNGLHTLVLWNNQISYQSMPKLSAALVSNIFELEMLPIEISLKQKGC